MRTNKTLIGLIASVLSIYSFAKNEPISFYMVSPDKVAQYAKLDLLKDTTKAFENLKRYENWFFKSRLQMAKTFQNELNDFPQYQKIANNFIHTTWMLREGRTNNNLSHDNKQYWLDSEGLKSLKRHIRHDHDTSTYSKTANKFLENIQGIIFPDTLQAHHYALNLLAASLGVCNDSVVNRYIKNTDLKWTKEELRELLERRRIDLSNFLGNPPKNPWKSHTTKDTLIDHVINYFQMYNDRLCTDERWEEIFDKLDTLYRRSLLDLVRASIVNENPFNESAPTSIKNKECGCSHKEELNGFVFGFLPYWHVGDSSKWIDYEGISRLLYYGLHIDNDGTLEMPSGTDALEYLNDPENYEMVNDAHRHFVHFDWIIIKNDWDSFLANDSQDNAYKDFFENLSNQIDNLLNKKINSSFQRFVNALDFYSEDFEYRGDGVTLYFQNYPRTENATEAFNNFFIKLRERLSKKNEHVLVNIMMNRIDLAIEEFVLRSDASDPNDFKGIYSYSNFIKITSTPKYGKKYERERIIKDLRNYLFVIIEPPVSRSKRLVLSDLNQQLNGISRRNLMHSVVPVLWFDNIQWNQLQEDALYYSDAYYAWAIAPYVTDINANDSCRANGNLGMCMLQYFEKAAGSNTRQGKFPAFVCTHRWAFRLAAIITILISISVLFLYFISCRIAEFFNKRLAILLGIVVIPTAITMTLLSRLDPSLATYRDSFGKIPILILLTSVIVIALLQVYRKNDQPKRKGE